MGEYIEPRFLPAGAKVEAKGKYSCVLYYLEPEATEEQIIAKIRGTHKIPNELRVQLEAFVQPSTVYNYKQTGNLQINFEVI